MAVKIRLKRAGSRHRPFYKIIVTDSRSPRDGSSIESLGHYDPLKRPEVIEVNEDRLSHWLSVGASTSESVDALLRRMKRRREKGGVLKAEEEAKPAVAVEEPRGEAAGAEVAEDAEVAAGAEAASSEESDAESEQAGGAEADKTGEAPEEEKDQ